MPTIDDYKLHLMRSDYAMLALVLGTALVVGVLILLYRKWASAPGMIRDTGSPLDFDDKPFTFPLPRITIGGVLAVALALRLPLMGQSFWYDEAFTQRLTTLSFAQLPAAIMADTHPPLFYTLIWLWSRLVGSHSEFLLRLPSLAFGLLLIYLLYRLVKASGLSQTTALIAALLCAVTPAAIYYASELRNYAMLTCAVLGALIAILEDRPKAFVLCVMLVGWLHNLGLLYVPFLCIGACLLHYHVLMKLPLATVAARARHAPNRWTHYERLSLVEAPTIRAASMRRWIVAALMAGALALVWFPLILQQSQSISDGFWIYFNPGVPAWLFSLNLLYVPMELIFPILLPYIGVLLGGFYGAQHWLAMIPGRLLLLVMIGAPLLAILVSMFWAPVFLPRLFLPVTLLALIPLAESLNRHRAYLVFGTVTLSLAALVMFYTSAAPLIRPDYRTMMRESCAGTSALYATAIDTAITVAPYWNGPMLVWEGSADRGGTFKPGQLPLYGFREGEISELHGQQVCLVYIFTPRTLQPERDKVDSIRRNYLSTVRQYRLHDELEVDILRVEVP